jgi:hypothetical protein
VAWTPEQKREAAILAPMTRDLVREDTRVIARPGWYQIITPSTNAYLNEVYLSDVDEGDAERVIDEVIATYRAHDLSVKWCVGPWTRPHDFGERLTCRGFECWDARAMTCDSSLAPKTRPGVAVEEVTRDTLEEWVETSLRGWSGPLEQKAAEVECHTAAMNARPRTAHFFAARADGRMVGTAGLGMREGYAYLVGAQVLEIARGRGAYAALNAVRLAFLRERGVTLAVTHAREATSAPLLEHLGFETLFRWKVYRLA